MAKDASWDCSTSQIYMQRSSPTYLFFESDCKTFRMNEATYYRSEHIVMHNGKKIDLVVYDPEYRSGWVILYLHGNSSSKVEAYSIR